MIKIATNLDLQAELRGIAETHEKAEKERIRSADRIRSALRERAVSGGGSELLPPIEELLEQIRNGSVIEPVRLLGETYRRSLETEGEAEARFRALLVNHPAWPWLERVNGVGPLLAGKLLARLDPRRAPSPSSFWAFCGLATVPSVEYRCAACGYVAGVPEGSAVPDEHVALGSSSECTGKLERARGAAEGVRVAQRKPTRAQPATYDAEAKKVCSLIGASLIRAGGGYADRYRQTKTRLYRERAGWPPLRIHLAALRTAEKLFLAHLWLVWRESLGLSTRLNNEEGVLQHPQYVEPWEMVSR